MSATSLLLMLLAAVRPADVPCPLEQTLAYSRDTLPGIPPGNRAEGPEPKPIATSYFVYLVTAHDCPPEVAAVWVRGAYHTATVRKVASPVRIPRDTAVPTAESIVLVPATASSVYQVGIGDEVPWTAATAEERRLAQDNELVVFVFLERDATRAPCAVRTITRLPPVAGQ